MKTLRTPDECFAGLYGFDFEPHYAEVPDGEGGALRIHCVDETPAEHSGETLLCMHGQPSWSYLYRNMLPLLTAAGHRVVCPDLVGFGRSDKPASIDDYTYQRHVDWMSAWLEALDLNGITLVCQDWGGLIGLRMVAAFPERFARVVVANSGLPDGIGMDGNEVPVEMAETMRETYRQVPIVDMPEIGVQYSKEKGGPPAFFYWCKHAAEHPNFHPRNVMANTLWFKEDVGETERERILDAYAAPFPDASYLAGARKFPSLVPVFPDDPAIPANRKAWEALRAFDKPFLTAFADGDPVTDGFDKRFQEQVPGAAAVQHVVIENAGHFLQADQPEAFAQAVLSFMERH